MPRAPAREALRDLLQRYDAPRPRYTSYPTAPWFTEDFDRPTVEALLPTVDDHIALYAHVPFCEQRCLFCGCNTLIKRDRSLGTAYINQLVAELHLLAGKLGRRRVVEQLALGGGTPTFLLGEDIARFVGAVRSTFDVARDAELSIEVDPRSVMERDLENLCNVGFTRFSFGVQDLDAEVMKAVGREQSPTTVARCFQVVRHLGARSINADLLYGLPLQTEQTMRRTIDGLLALAPDRIALFGYAHVPWLKPHQRGLERFALPDANGRIELHLQAREQLINAGYVQIGMDHFARNTDALAVAARSGLLRRNFMGYTTGAGLDLLSVGTSAISHFRGAFVQNTTKMSAYTEAVTHCRLPWAKGLQRTLDDAVRGEIIEALMCDRPIDIAAIERTLNRAFADYFGDALVALQPLIDDGLVAVSDDAVAMTERGRLVVRHAAAAFDARVHSNARYSRTS